MQDSFYVWLNQSLKWSEDAYDVSYLSSGLAENMLL